MLEVQQTGFSVVLIKKQNIKNTSVIEKKTQNKLKYNECFPVSCTNVRHYVEGANSK